MFNAEPVSWLQAAVAGLTLALFIGAVFNTRMRMPKAQDASSARSRWSIVGVAIQSLAFGISGVGPVRVGVPSATLRSLILSAVVLGFGLAGVVLFARSARALGANWSIIARTRAGHGLVQDGPFARLRHPIYLAMLLMLIGVGVGFGHAANLLAGIPVLLIGTAIRIREEERLLRLQFGEDYARYARTTPAFLPRLRPRP